MQDRVPLRVLLVEDSETDAFLLLRTLKAGGYEVTHTRVCTAADLAVELDREWDVVISDFAMPGFSGTEALAMFKQRKLDLPFIIVSGTIGDEDAVAAMRAGAHDYLLKDKLARLAPTIDRELREAQNRRAFRIAEIATREAQRLQQEAEAASRAKTMFLATVSHELRTPLNAIIGFSELLTYEGSALGHSLTTQQREYMQHVLASGRHLLALIDDLLDLSKVDAGKMILARVSISIADVIKLVTDMIEPLAKSKGLHLEIVVAHDLPQISVDPLRIRQIFYNLLSNAIKFTPTGGTVTLRAELTEDAIRISVRDTGIGISSEDMPRLFHEFERVGSPEAAEGTGLGLALTKKLVELHDGSIEAVSSPSQGSTFTVLLPRTASAAEAEPGVPAESSAPIILVVDSDAPSRRFVRDLLTQRGYQVIESSDVDDALTIMRKNPIRIVLAETRIAGGGARLLEEIRDDEALRKIPVLAIEDEATAHDDSTVLAFDDHFTKPIDTNRLRLVVDALLRKA